MSKKTPYKKIRLTIVLMWVIIGAILLISVLTINQHMEIKPTIHKLAMGYVFASTILSGIVYSLKKKK